LMKESTNDPAAWTIPGYEWQPHGNYPRRTTCRGSRSSAPSATRAVEGRAYRRGHARRPSPIAGQSTTAG
jgi:hypothetical protein